MQSIPVKSRNCSRFMLILKIQRSDKFQVPLAPFNRHSSGDKNCRIFKFKSRRVPPAGPRLRLQLQRGGPGLRLGRVSVPTIVRAHWQLEVTGSLSDGGRGAVVLRTHWRLLSLSRFLSGPPCSSLRPGRRRPAHCSSPASYAQANPGPGLAFRQHPPGPAASGVTARLPVTEWMAIHSDSDIVTQRLALRLAQALAGSHGAVAANLNLN
jgi:hypothetical protein